MTSPLVRLDSSSTDTRGTLWSRALGPAIRTLRCEPAGHAALHEASGNPIRQWSSPLSALQWLDEYRRPGRRWVGYLSYDLGWWLEPAAPRVASDFPLFVFTEHELTSAADVLPSETAAAEPSALDSNFSHTDYLRAVCRAIDYIGAGDIFQVNLAQQLEVRSPLGAASIYAAIQRTFPATHAALLDYGDFALVCNSPELFLRTWRDGCDRRIETRPIKGTRPRNPGMDVELRDSIKDQAELNMIVDLERNDLGRICRIGTVKVSEPRIIEEHPTVYHGAATITGELATHAGLVDILHATFPGGSITGAPKIRAMQIIHELEPTPRGPYCGAIGYLDSDGEMQFNIAIRTLIVRDGIIRIPVGGGIVADSVPEQEFQETLVKARAALRVLGIEPQNERE